MYNNLVESGSFLSLQVPKTFLPTPSDSDYSDGFIDRYFTQKVNDKTSPVFEVGKDTYNDLLSNSFWSTVKLKWRIKGQLEPVFNDKGILIDPGVRNSNLNEITKNQKSIPPLKTYLINPLQFYKPYKI
jgi:hypothetical protein